MERDEPTISGWRKFKRSFVFGAAKREVEQQEPATCQPYDSAPLDEGCSRAVVDFDRMDQQ